MSGMRTRRERAEDRLHALRLPYALATASLVGRSDEDEEHEDWLIGATDDEITEWAANVCGFAPMPESHDMRQFRPPLRQDEWDHLLQSAHMCAVPDEEC